MKTSRLKPLLDAEETTWMVNPGGASIDAVDMLARLGVRCLFIDCERTAIGIESVTALVRCAHSNGMAALLRTESMRPEIMVRYLDRGIDGIVVPHVETVAELKAIGETVAYVAKGRKEQIISLAQIESQAAVSNIAALAAEHSVDGFLIGPNDLSHSMGFTGNTSQPEVVRAIDDVIAVLEQRNRTWAIPGLPESAPRWSERGARLLYCTMEQILRSGYGGFTTSVTRCEKTTD
jgi:4-hydroxy-2-oxoheptanedioate aldolase